MLRRIVVTFTFIFAAMLALAPVATADGPQANDYQGSTGNVPAGNPATRAQVITSIAYMHLAFTENQGQWDERILFRANAGGATMWFTRDGTYYQFTRRVPRESTTGDDTFNRMHERLDREPDSLESIMIEATFVGANSNPRMIGDGLMDYKCNYFIGNDPSKWRTDVPNYEAIVVEDIYAGIDLTYYGNGIQMEYDLVVSPGADYSKIQIQYSGAESLTVDDDGALVVTTKWGEMRELAPVVYQEVGGNRRPVTAEYVIQADGAFGFRLGAEYDPTLPVTIDPVLVYSTYLGGDHYDKGWGIAIDGSGCAYVTGETQSGDFPTENPIQPDHAGIYSDVFVTKLSALGNSLVYSTYFGGLWRDYGYGIAVDGSGCAYVTGETESDDFPTETPIQADNPNGGAFVTKLSASGNSLIYSTYLGGSSAEWGNGIAVDGSGCAYVTGETQSGDFPTETPIQAFKGRDAFVTKLSASGDSWVYSTFLGGQDYDLGYGIAVDGSGCAYVTGLTMSIDFPTLGPFPHTPLGGNEAFVTKLNAAGNSLVYSACFGGQTDAAGVGIAVDGGGCAYVAGATDSPDFPTTLNAYQPNMGGGYGDAFVMKLSVSGNSLVYSTFLGGQDYDESYGIAVDGRGRAYVTGSTKSPDFPTQVPFQANLAGYTDAYITVLSESGKLLVYSTYLGGGESHDGAYGIAIDGSGCVYVTGATLSDDFPTETPYEPVFQGYGDAFVAKLCMADVCIKDNLADLCLEPNTTDYSWGVYWDSESIFVTKGGPGGSGSTHSNPVVNKQCWVNVRYENVSDMWASGNIYVYFTPSASGAGWEEGVPYTLPAPFNQGTDGHWIQIPGSIPVSIGPNTVMYGYVLWTPAYSGDFCMLARYVSNPRSADPIGKEVKKTADNVERSNNIAAMNLKVVAFKLSSHDLIWRNIDTIPVYLDFWFTTQSTMTEDSCLDCATFDVQLGPEVFERWQMSGGESHNIEIIEGTRVRVVHPSDAWLYGIPFDVEEQHVSSLQFELPDDPPPSWQEICDYSVVQFSTSQQGGDSSYDGSMTYRMDKDAIYSPVVIIEKTHNTMQGRIEEISITIEAGDFDMGGFDFLIAYDASALKFMEAEPGQLLEDCDWEYFTYRHGADDNCGDACPSGLLRLIAVADLPNGTSTPSCFGPPDADPYELARLRFFVTEDMTFESQYIPIKFYWADCGDNSISSVDGQILYLDRAIYDFTGLLLWDEDDDDQFPEDARPQGVGAPDYCLEGEPEKGEPLRFIDFWYGGIDIIPIDSIDAKGDINLNSVINEIGDAVLFANYFIYGPSVWHPLYYEGQIAATDINNDGITLTIADLVYLIRIITGDAIPFPRPVPEYTSAMVDWRVDQDNLIVDFQSMADAGAVLLAFDHQGMEFGKPVLGENSSGMTMISHDNGSQLRILLFSLQGGARIPAGEGTIVTVPLITGDHGLSLAEVQAADYQGNTLTVESAKVALPTAFELLQNYPNPFNAGTVIRFALPTASDWQLRIYNVTGQLVDEFAGHAGAGYHTVRWETTDKASGVYFYKLIAGDFTDTRKMVLTK